METGTVVIGASAAGLAAAACIKGAGESFVLLEATQQVGSAWRGHYDRLHLHTPRGGSSLPGLKMPASYPLYPARDQVVEYLEAYTAHHGLNPQFGQRVDGVERDGEGWTVRAGSETYSARNVVLATGYTRVPHRPNFDGEDTFGGEVVHSSEYKNGAAWRNKNVLVVGFGNSAGEIAIDLCEQGANPTISVRSPVNVIPRDALGLPILGVGIFLAPLPAAVADAFSWPLMRILVGNIEKLGLKKLPYGPIEQIRKYGRIPLLDIGTLACMRSGALKVAPGVTKFTQGGVEFTDGSAGDFDAVVLATGYRPELGDFVEDAASFCDDQGVPKASGAELAPGLFACGFYVSPTGMLREIGIEAKRVAKLIAARTKQISN